MDLKLEMTQTLGLSQKMIQSTEILQMSSAELEAYLKEVAVDNPVVEFDEAASSAAPAPERKDNLLERLEWLAGSDEQNKEYYSEEYASEDEDKQDMWNITDNRGENLEDYLKPQTVLFKLDARAQAIIEYMIGLLDSRGYYSETISETAKAWHEPEEKILELLKKIQSLEPAGVGARDLKECLLIQLDRQENPNPVLRAIIQDYLPELGKNHLPQIAKKMKLTVEDVKEALQEIRKLNPKPGNSFSSKENLKYIVPDVTVVKDGDGFKVLLGDQSAPRFNISNYYKNMLKNGNQREVRDYVGTKIRQAEWIMQCVTQRNRTLLGVANTIVASQDSFFREGPGHLKPLVMAEAADILEIHESTVSRAVKDKFLQCSWGVFPMNYFFTGAAGRDMGGIQSSADEVKKEIRDIIEGEDPKKPLSDQKITQALEKKGIKISRRTVAKYREAMGIRDASGRKAFGGE